ncbi:MAG: hypothetical protein AAFO77_10210 [Pseudomonadota bacterium]
MKTITNLLAGICLLYGTALTLAFSGDKPVYLTHPDAIDGATLKNGSGDTFRVFAITPPINAHDCVDDGGPVDCERKAAAMLELFAASFLKCEDMGTFDGSPALRCRDYQGRDIGARMVLMGWAVPDRTVGDHYIFEEIEAEARGNGIWRRRVSAVD